MDLAPRSTREDLVALLQDGHVLTTAELADRLDVSKRHVRRLINEQLRPAGVSIQDRKRGREKEFFLPEPDWRTPGLPVDLTERQLLALVVAAQAARAKLRPTPLAEFLTEAVDVLRAAHPDPALSFEANAEPDHWHFSDAPSVPLDPEVFWTLREAASARQSVRIDYHSASSGRVSTGRKIDPLLIAERRGSWLCVAYCHEREGLRDFSLAGMSDVELCTDEYFTPPTSFDRARYFEGRFGAVAGDAVHTVRLLAEPDRAPYFRRKTYHPSQEIEEAREDGRLVVSYEVAGLDEVASFVQSWGVGVTVLDPPQLAERIAAEAETVAARYETDS